MIEVSFKFSSFNFNTLPNGNLVVNITYEVTAFHTKLKNTIKKNISKVGKVVKGEVDKDIKESSGKDKILMSKKEAQ